MHAKCECIVDIRYAVNDIMDIRKRWKMENFPRHPSHRKCFIYESAQLRQYMWWVRKWMKPTRSYNRLEFIIISDKLTLNSQYIFYFRCSSISSSQQFGDRWTYYQWHCWTLRNALLNCILKITRESTMGDGPATGGPLTMSAASAWFWNPNIWLPPNVTWESFQEEASAENESNINRKPLRSNGYWFLIRVVNTLPCSALWI